MPARPDPLRAAFLVCDIVSARALADRVGDEAWLELLVAHRGLVRAEAEPRGGEEVAFRTGGSILAFERGTADAAQCAMAIQRAVAARTAAAALDVTPSYEVRIGLHTGSALRHERTLIGRAVNHACRLAEAGQPGEILISPIAAGEAGAITEPVTLRLGGAAGRLPARRLDWEPRAIRGARRFARVWDRAQRGAHA